MKKPISIIAAAGLFLLGVVNAQAFEVTLGDTKDGSAVSAVVNAQVYSEGTDLWSIFFDVLNTDDGLTDRITGFAVDILSSSSVEATYNSLGWGVVADGSGTLPGNTAFDVCWYAKSNCGSGGPDGIEDGEEGTFAILFYDDSFSSIGHLRNALMAGYLSGSLGMCTRHISIGAGDYSDVACQGEIVPEPGSLALLGLGLLGFGLARQRRIG